MNDTRFSSPEPGLSESRIDLVTEFVGSNADYYSGQFTRIGASSRFPWTFNWVAGALGPVWLGMRGLWNWALPFVVLEAFAVIQIARGLWGDLGADARERIAQVEGTLNLRREQLEAAIQKNAANVDVFRRNVESLENAIGDFRLDVELAEASAIWVAAFGFAMLAVVKLAQGVLANPLLERRFSDWLSDSTIASGLDPLRTAISAGFASVILGIGALHFANTAAFPILTEFPTDPAYRLTAIDWVEAFIDWLKLGSVWFFENVTFVIRVILDALELIFVETPWIIVCSFIVFLTGLAAGPRAAIWSGTFLAYMGLLGFWEKAMTTLALLGTAACISIALGIPLGMFCARRPRFYAIIRPIMDFMQTMPAFVFMIPVIAFFGVGKPAAIVVTMIFGGTPVVRLTVLGLRGVPETIREAAIAYGASKWYLLTKVDLPLAAPSILAGINQTIMLSLAMVVVASLIGAKGLGEDVLEALQYASVGQGILAGFAILFCAMILDRVVQGKRA